MILKWKKRFYGLKKNNQALRHVLISPGCYKRIAYTGWLKQEAFVSHSSGGWRGQDRRTDRSRVWRIPCSLSADGGPLAVCSHGGWGES